MDHPNVYVLFSMLNMEVQLIHAWDLHLNKYSKCIQYQEPNHFLCEKTEIQYDSKFFLFNIEITSRVNFYAGT